MTVTVKFSLYLMDLNTKINHEQYDKVTVQLILVAEGLVRTGCQSRESTLAKFSKSVLDIRTRLVVTIEPETKWMPNSDSASKLMPKCKILVQYDLPNYFCSC